MSKFLGDFPNTHPRFPWLVLGAAEYAPGPGVSFTMIIGGRLLPYPKSHPLAVLSRGIRYAVGEGVSWPW
jgi:hypothetical protein